MLFVEIEDKGGTYYISYIQQFSNCYEIVSDIFNCESYSLMFHIKWTNGM